MGMKEQLDMFEEAGIAIAVHPLYVVLCPAPHGPMTISEWLEANAPPLTRGGAHGSLNRWQPQQGRNDHPALTNAEGTGWLD